METAIENKDAVAQLRSTLKLVDVELGFKRIEVTKRLMLDLVMKGVRDAKTPDESRRELLNAFSYTAGVRSMAQSELVDAALSTEAENQLKVIAGRLDELEPEGRRALAPFLDSFDLDERVCAAVALLDLMPDRAIPVLRELVKNAPGTNAGATALARLDELDKHASEGRHAQTPVQGERPEREPDMLAGPRTDTVFENLLQLLDEFKNAIESKDAAAQRLLAVKLAGLNADWNKLVAAQRLKLASVMTPVRDAKTPEERRQALLNAFTSAAQVFTDARYDLVDDDLTKEAETQLKAIASALDELEPEGRRALAVFLDSPDLDVRVCAAKALPHLMGKRVVAVLSAVIRDPASGNAALTAYEALYGPVDRQKNERRARRSRTGRMPRGGAQGRN